MSSFIPALVDQSRAENKTSFRLFPLHPKVEGSQGSATLLSPRGFPALALLCGLGWDHTGTDTAPAAPSSSQGARTNPAAEGGDFVVLILKLNILFRTVTLYFFGAEGFL